MENNDRKYKKLFQYFMILVIFAAAVCLPPYAAKWQAAKAAGEGVSAMERLAGEASGMQEAQVDGENSEADTAENPAKNARNDEAEEATDTGETMQSGGADEVAQTGENSQTIVIDPGHGGDDPGMVGASGISEKVLNLVYAQKLAALLTEEGFRVVLTRTTEDGLYDADASNKKAQDMQRRVAIIEEENPVLTVSIHQNSYSDSSVRGPQVFYYEQSAEGEALATAIQDSLNEELAIERPRTQKGNTTYYILKRSVSTTVIVECGFLTNPEEEALLQEENYQDQVVQAICDGILEYLRAKNAKNE